MGWGKLDNSEFKSFADQVHKKTNSGEFKRGVEQSLTDAGEYLVGEIKKRTPVDHGDLRRAWRPSRANYNGSTFVLTVTNTMEYASFVESGHRQKPGRYVPAIGKKLTAKWVNGQFMMRDAVAESKARVVAKLEDELNKQVAQLFD